MLSIKGGILIERDTSTLIEENLAVLFTISHPFDDVCPITCRRSLSFLKGIILSNGSCLHVGMGRKQNGGCI